MMSTNTVNDIANVTLRSVLGTTFRCSTPAPCAAARQQVDRQHVHGVEQEYPAENGQRQRREQLVGAVKAVLDLGVDELDHAVRRSSEICPARPAVAVRAAR